MMKGSDIVRAIANHERCVIRFRTSPHNVSLEAAVLAFVRLDAERKASERRMVLCEKDFTNKNNEGD